MIRTGVGGFIAYEGINRAKLGFFPTQQSYVWSGTGCKASTFKGNRGVRRKQGSKLYVGNLSYSVSIDELGSIFAIR